MKPSSAVSAPPQRRSKAESPLLIRHFLTAKDTAHRLAAQAPLFVDAIGDSILPTVLIDRSVVFQEMEGFGGAFTEAAAVTWRKMSAANQQLILEAYFGRESGHGYSLCRTHINSCDFSLGNYACAEVPGDLELKHFSIERQRSALLPMMREAQALAGEKIKLLASPWSPPAWMKTNGQMNGGGKLKPECRQVWADHYVRFIQEYEKEGVSTWGLTVQNEPAAAQRWDSCVYSGEEERDFVRDYLGPTLHRAGLERIKIIIWDHNRDLLVHRARTAYSDAEAAKYIWGTGFHWYADDKFENLQFHHDAWPEKKLLFTEGCQEGGAHLGSWALGERYGRSMIHDFNRWTAGWIDWNLVLDETGGPNHVNNLCSAPILANPQTDTVIFQSSYYYIGHFARFVRPGARRILCATSQDNLQATAFVNRDGQMVVIAMNSTDEELTFTLDFVESDSSSTAMLPAHAIATYLVDCVEA